MNVGIIGCGKQAPKHIAALKKLNISNIVVSDIQPELATKLAKQFDLRFSPHPEEVLKDAAIDIVDICTPTPTHFTYAQQALLSGKHVFCEKPLTPDADEAAQLLALARQQNLKGMVAFVFKYHPVFTQAKTVIEAGAIGTLRAIFMRLGGKGSHRAWKHQTATGGGVVNEMMSHMLDLLLWFIGGVDSLETVSLDNLIKQRQIDGSAVASHAEDFAIVTGKSLSGTKFVVETDLISQSYTNHIEIIGDAGYMILSILDSQKSYIFLNHGNGAIAKGKTPLKFESVDLFELMFADFFNNIRQRKSLQKNTFGEAVKLANLIEEIKRKGNK